MTAPILVKVHFDGVMTMIADTFYSLLARKLRGFETCDAAQIYRLFFKGKATVSRRARKSPSPSPAERIIHPALGALASVAPIPLVAEWSRIGTQIQMMPASQNLI